MFSWFMTYLECCLIKNHKHLDFKCLKLKIAGMAKQ